MLFYGHKMALKGTFPKRGHVLICDFSSGFKAPEMVKVRPVIVVSPSETNSRRLCCVIPLSTTEPKPVKSWHVQLAKNPVPNWNPTAVIWAKCDMVMTVSFERLDRPHRRQGGKRDYYLPKLSEIELQEVINGVESYLQLTQPRTES